MKIIFLIVFSLLSRLLYATEVISVQVENSDELPPFFGSSTLKMLISAIGALFLLNAARILLDPDSGDKTKGFVRVVIGLAIIYGLTRLF